MNYKTNDSGDVAVADVKGEIKFLPRHLAENENLMKVRELTPLLEPVAYDLQVEESYSNDQNDNFVKPHEPKKRGPKPKTVGESDSLKESE